MRVVSSTTSLKPTSGPSKLNTDFRVEGETPQSPGSRTDLKRSTRNPPRERGKTHPLDRGSDPKRRRVWAVRCKGPESCQTFGRAGTSVDGPRLIWLTRKKGFRERNRSPQIFVESSYTLDLLSEIRSGEQKLWSLLPSLRLPFKGSQSRTCRPVPVVVRVPRSVDVHGGTVTRRTSLGDT